MYDENTIMIIDNDPINRYNLKETLWKLNYAVYETEGSVNAITHVIKTKPRRVFISLDTAKADNFELIDKINELHNCTLIIYSNKITKQDVASCIKASVDEVILNPCEQIERLQNILEL